MPGMVNGNCFEEFGAMCGSLGGGGGSGTTPYQYAVKNGYTGTEEEFARAFIGVCNYAVMYDAICNKMVLEADSVEKVNAIFKEWWTINAQFCNDKQFLLGRWFGTVLNDDRVHGVKLPLFSTSTSAIGELTDDSKGLSCTPSTAAKAGRDDFAYLPQFWTLEVAMERHADGSHTVNKIEFIDDIEDVRSGKYGLCQVLQKNTWTKEWKDSQYHYMQMCCNPADKSGWHTWPQGTDRNGAVYAYIANPKYAAGIGADGIVTCGTRLAPVNFTSHNAGVALWRKRGAQYSGVAGNLIKWQLAMIWLKYARKGNSGTIEGCSSYYWGYPAAVSETAATRIVVTEANANAILDGCSVAIGLVTEGGTFDQWGANKYNVFKHKRIKSIESVTIGGTKYKAINLELAAGETIDTVAGRTYISSVPYASGWNDGVLGYDGSRINYTNGKEPGLIQRTEFQNGAFLILSDELWQWETEADGSYSLNCYTCHDQSKVTTDGSISSNYEKQTDLTLVFAKDYGDKWTYIEDIAIGADPGILWPAKVSTAAGSGTGVKAGCYIQPRSSGVRAAWCFCALYSSGYAGLAARSSSDGTTNSFWYAAVGAPSGISG